MQVHAFFTRYCHVILQLLKELVTATAGSDVYRLEDAVRKVRDHSPPIDTADVQLRVAERRLVELYREGLVHLFL